MDSIQRQSQKNFRGSVRPESGYNPLTCANTMVGQPAGLSRLLSKPRILNYFHQIPIPTSSNSFSKSILTLGFNQETEAEDSQNICFIGDLSLKYPCQGATFSKFVYQLKEHCAQLISMKSALILRSHFLFRL
jgi:hypothetical protein